MSRHRFRERWSLPGRRASPSEVGARMTAWLLDAVQALGGDLSWRTVDDLSREDDELVHRRLAMEGAEGSSLRARAQAELALSRGNRPGGSGRVELVRTRPWAHVRIDTHGGEEHWDVEAFGVTEVTFEALREAHARSMGEAAAVGGARKDAPDETPVILARGSGPDLAQWLSDLEAIGAEARREDDAVVVTSLAPPDLDELYEARVTLGEILAEAGEDDWEIRALEVLFALTAG